MVNKALTLPVPNLPQFLSLPPPASLSECNPRRCTPGYCSLKGSRKLAFGAKVIRSLCVSVTVNVGQGQKSHFTLPSFLCLRRLMAHHAQPYPVSLLLPIFFCCAARLPCKICEVKGSDPSSTAALLRGHTYAALPSQRCRNVTFNPFIILFLSLRLTSPESPFLPCLNHCSPIFFFSLNRSPCHT